ncbi:MAG: hypothetical protein HY791_13145 [Deltaproteobacteria bacterium]|nr:hypothetical protein [Deltaproteobacteria bacterium]
MSFSGGDPWEWLLSPFSRDRFLELHFRREPLLLQDRLGRYAGLFDVDDVAKMGHAASDRMRALGRLMRGRESLPIGPGAVVGQLRTAFGQGFTIQVNNVEEMAPALVPLQRAFEEFIDGEAHFNLYFSPPESRVFPPHADHHDALVLQIDGTKRWLVYEERRELIAASLRREDPPLPELLGPPKLEVTLAPGDFLYLPLGRFHHAETSADQSLHLTLGLYPYTAGKLLGDLLETLASSEPDFLEPISSWPPAERTTRIHRLLQILGARTDVDAAAARRRALLVSERTMVPVGIFSAEVDVEHEDELVEMRLGSRCALTKLPDSVVLSFPEGALKAPTRAESTLEAIAKSRGPFAAKDLPPDLPVDSRILLLNRLIKAGLLVKQSSKPT